jgi:4'-phosphopantetheinyl transferase
VLDVRRVEAGEVYVWSVPLDGEHHMAADRALLSAAELERANRFVTADLRRRFILARAALRRVVGRCMHVPPETLEFELGPHGKPSLREAGTLQFNLSHSGELALIAVTSMDPVGVDVEQIREVHDAEAIAARFFSDAEQHQFRMLAAEDRMRGFFRCWTRKEAFIKATGEGLSRSLGSFDVTLTPDEPPRLTRIDAHDGTSDAWMLQSFEPAPGYEAAVAVRRRGATLLHLQA